MKKPFIHTFCTSGGYYVYDVNTDTILQVSKSVYDKLINGNPAELEEDLYVKRLKDYGYLKPNRKRITEHPDTRFIRYFAEKKVEGIILQLTQNCNLRCKYCVYSGGYYNRTHANKRMTFETAKKGIQFLLTHSSERPEKTISFYGGEPLLEFQLMKKIILWTENEVEGQNINFNFTTNATLLTEEIISFLESHNVMMLISLDGPEEIHDQFRVFADDEHGSFSTVIKNIRLLKEKFPQYFYEKVCFNTVFAANDFSCVEKYITGEELFNHSSFLSSVVNGVNKIEKVSIKNEFITETRYILFLGMLYKLGRIKKIKQMKLLESVISEMGNLEKNYPKRVELPEKWHHGGPCIPGILRLFIDVDGKFYPCEKVSELNEQVCIGNLEKGFDYEKMKAILNIEKFTSQKCKECWAYQDCRLCVACFDSKLDSKFIEEKCNMSKSKIESAYKDYCVLQDLKDK